MSSAGAALVLRLARAMPLRLLARRELVRTSGGAALVAATMTLVAGAALDALGTEDPRRTIAAVLGVVIALGPSALASRRRRTERALTRLAELLPGSSRPGLIRRLLLERTSRLTGMNIDPSTQITLLCLASRALRTAGFVDDAQTLVRSIDETRLESGARAAVRFERAAIALGRGEIEAADALLAGDDAATVALRALSHAVQGGADQALDCLERGAFERESGVIASAARAHAFVSMGRDDEARRVLGELVASHGLAALTWALRPVGPATDQARSLLALGVTNENESA